MAETHPEPIAVIGMACRFPGNSNSPSKLWELIESPRNLSKRVPKDRFDTTGFNHTNGSYHGASDATDAYFLEENIANFDNAFFNIQPAEAEAIDPQQRLLMETVYDSLCAGGQTIEGLRGTDTAVYVGMMCDDWAQLLNRDWDTTLTYAATGQSRAIISNRVSYYFDWHGPSTTVDTACSSSLVAVHQGVMALRNGECPVAVAAGANLILSPGMWIAESKLHMLSPTGSSKMWDESADGYARGEGIAAIVMKKLSDALRDGDPIDCIIRGTGVNQDGRTPGLTMPNNAAQAQLIRDTYARAGLDIKDPKDRPQFFHAHGTGTQAGDPQEAQAISSSFFPGDEAADTLLVGSIKTVIGHTEGSAGLASLISSALALQHGTIPPNLHFQNLSPKVAPFYSHLEIPTSARPWPTPLPGQPRRASVNSFGFGGTNAHAIIESYEPLLIEESKKSEAAIPVFTPLTVSAGSSAALRNTLSDLKTYLETHPDTNMRDLAYTFQARRSTLAYRKTIMYSNIEEAISRIDALLADAAGDSSLSIRRVDVSKPKILGVFTGQGAQWPRMGARLIEQSTFAAERIAELDRALAALPESDRPQWSLRDELLADAKNSRLSEATIAQPLCTAVQIVLVDLLKAANIQLAGVVGHSSGEIGAAYAAGFLSATNAIYIAYYRGLYAKLAGVGGDIRGAMMAVGTTYEDALELCELDDYIGRIQVAACNSSNSVTVSGDEDAVDDAEAIFKDEEKFARKLRVDTAYHSRHMLSCVTPYLEGLARSNVTVQDGNGTPWFSSVVDGKVMTKDDVKPQYWVDNMVNAVLFAPAIETAIAQAGPFDMGIEFGPHPALKGPCLDTVEEVSGKKIPYTGLLGRGKNDVEELALGLGSLWTELGAGSVNFDGFEKEISGSPEQKKVVTNLPTYPFDHQRPFYSLTRYSGGFQHIHDKPHPLIGRRCIESETENEVAWRQLLRPHEISWLQGHQLQGQAVFPAMGYVAMALEAVAALAGPDRKLGLIGLEDVVIGRALTFSDDNAGVECRITMTIDHLTNDDLRAQITCHSGLPFDGATPLALNFNATVTASFHEPEPDTLPPSRVDEVNLVPAEAERLYSQFTSLGYNYSHPFTGVRTVQRKMNYSTGDIEDESGDDWEDQLLLHPGFLDSSIQTGFAAYCHPFDNRLWALHIPTSIRSIFVNPYFFTKKGAERNRQFKYQASTRTTPEIPMVVDIDIFSGEEQSHPFVTFDSVGVKPFAAPTARDDSCVFSRTQYRISAPDAAATIKALGKELAPTNSTELLAVERMGFFYLRRLHETFTQSEKAELLPHHQRLLDNAARLVDLVSEGKHSTVKPEALNDSPAFIRSLIAKHHSNVSIKLLEVVGKHLEDVVRNSGDMMEYMTQDGLLDQFYEQLSGARVPETEHTWYGHLLSQLAYRFPRMHIMEIGAGNGTSTLNILSSLDGAYETYTYTDVSDELFDQAQDRLQKHSSRMVFSKYDMEKTPGEQSYEENSYDVVLAVSALHNVTNLDNVLSNARRLLKPGGYLIVGDIVSNDFLSINTILGSLPEWWAGAELDSARVNGPCLDIEKWNELTLRHGFGGVDTHVPIDRKQQCYSVFACQAVDDRVLSLRDPLAASAANPIPSRGHLVIVGGRKAAVAKLAAETRELIKARYETITEVGSLEELNARGLASGSSVLCLAELDQQLLENRNATKLESLKTLWRNGRSILYVTRSAQNSNAYSGILVGLSRVVRFEHPNINFQLCDFDAVTAPTPEVLAESLIRLELGCQWLREEEGVNLLWTLEPEVYHVKGQKLIPRCLPLADGNTRYNTYRRPIQQEVNPQKDNVVLEAPEDGKMYEVCTPSPLRVLPAPLSKKTRMIQVKHSLLQSIKVQEAGFMTLCAGEDEDTGESLIALLDTAVESRVNAVAEWTARAPEEASTNIGAIAAHLVAQSILAAVPHFGTILVHEADEVLKDALDKEAAAESLNIVFTTAVKQTKAKTQVGTTPQTIFVHQRLPMRLVQSLLPRQVSAFVNLSPECPSATLIAQCLPSNTPIHLSTEFIRSQAKADPTITVKDVGQNFSTACRTVTKTMQRQAAFLREEVPIVPLQSVASYQITHSTLSVVDWNTTSVNAQLRPIDSGIIFRADATYLLFGLAGELGQSLCSWMVAHGARYIVLGSRRPQVDPRFIKSLADQGATVKVMTVDLTERDSLYACCDSLCSEMPPVAGVANGALVLEDSLFDDLEFESFDRTAKPKIDGSLLLDELFYDSPLDFFILFTSAVCVSGNTGQSAYIMANSFMTSLAAERRDIRGVPGSSIALAAMAGLGRFERSDHLDKDHFAKMGYQDSSEQDLHQLFAEAVLAGRPDQASVGDSQVASGLTPVRKTPKIQAQLREDPRFSHFMLPDASGLGRPGGDGGNGKSARPRVRLAGVTSRAEARAIVQEAFVERLKRVLQVPQNETLNESITLVEQGVDSIVAVEIRTWFLSELEADLPVLKILGAGSTVQALLDDAMERIPTSILDWEKLGDGDSSGEAAAPSSKPVAEKTKPALPKQSLPTPSVPTSSVTTPELESSRELEASITLSSSSGATTPPETDSSASVCSQPSLSIPEIAQKELTVEKEELGAALQWRKQIIDSSTELTQHMTYGQKRFWFLNHFVDEPSTFNFAYMARLQGRLRVDTLAKAVEMVALRHEALRTRFFWSDDNAKTPMQGILSKPLVRLETVKVKSEAEAHQELYAMRQHTWDLGDWVPVRLRLLSLSDTVQWLAIGAHHISLDGHSFTIMMLEIERAYNNPGQIIPLPDHSQLRAFGEQQRIAYESGQFKSAIDSYRRMFSAKDLAQPIELFSFARSQVRPPLDSYDAHVARRVLDPTVAAALKQLARRHRATSFHAYLATLQSLLFRLLPTDTTDKVFIGMADANRLDSEFMGSVGNLLNVLPLRFDRVNNQTFGHALAIARSRANSALEHSALPFDLLLDELAVPRSNAWAPVFQVFIDYRLIPSTDGERQWAGCGVSDETWYTSKSGYDVVLEIKEDQNETSVLLHVQKTLYDENAAELLLSSYINLLNQVVKQRDNVDMETLKKWDEVDIKKALEVGQGPNMGLEWPATVAHRVDQVITQNPEAIALKDGHGQSLTYSALDQRVQSIASALLEKLPTDKRSQVVGVFQMPTADYICSLLAINRVGAVYLPLDLRNGTARLESNVKAAKPVAILTDKDTEDRTNEIGVDNSIAVINVTEISVTMEAGKSKVETAAEPDEPAYIIFTSGSTGEAKGIVVTHTNLRANLEGFHRAWNIENLGNVMLQQAAFSFDASLLQIYAALTTGGCLLVVPADARGDPQEVTRLMAEHGVTMTQATPSEYDMWFRFAPENVRRCTSWKAAWFGGERASPGVLDGFRNACKILPNLNVFTSYGPTECTISAMKGEADVRDPELTVPVPGRLLPNYAAYIVDSNMQLVPVGVPGEIVLGGAGVGRNKYLNRPDLTEQAFQLNVFAKNQDKNNESRMYRTGDYGRLSMDGLLAIEGRISGDTQVKLRGFRIELAEIERVMIKEAGGLLTHAVVTLRGDNDQEAFLAAHVVLESKSKPQSAEVIRNLRARLPLRIPQYMCPAIIVALDDVPLTAHAKVDRKALQEMALPNLEQSSTLEQDQVLTPTERRLAALWADVLPPMNAPLTQDSDFFLAGGNSLVLVKLQAAIKREFSDAPRLNKLMNSPILVNMAALLDNLSPTVNWDKEIAPDFLDELPAQPARTKRSNGLCVLVTGATGQLGRRIVAELAENERVGHIVCLVRPVEGRDETKLFPEVGKKISVVLADLPSLPDSEVLSDVDTVVHCAANRTFWDSYSAAKPVNVDTVKALVKLCLRTGASLHVMSSGTVSAYETSRPNPDDGYASSKWVVEQYLANAVRLAGLRVTVHRPTQAPADAHTTADAKVTEMEAKLVHAMVLATPRLGVQPDFAHLGGWFDITTLNNMAGDVTTAITSEPELAASEEKKIHIINYPGMTRVRTDALAAYTEEVLGDGSKEEIRKLPVVSGLHFVGRAKRAGLFDWVVMAQEIFMVDDRGQKVVTRR